MANPKLSVEISANITTLVDNLKTATQVIDAFGNKAFTGLNATENKLRELGDVTLKKLNQDLKTSQSLFQLFGDASKNNVNKLNAYQTALTSLLNAGFRPTSKEVLQLTEKITGLNKVIENSKSPFSKLGVGSNQASIALMNLGRVAQDAPFGFIGIQNNLNPLLESFQQLKAQAGSNAGALKLLAGSLMGAGGVGLALSAVTALFTFYTMWSQKAAKADEEKAKNTKSAKEALDEYINSLNASNRAQIKGTVDAQKELITLRQLYDASRDLRLPLDERIKAAKALQDQYPKTFANFTAEQIALGKASMAYKQLSVDIIAVAKAAARTDILVENEKEIVQLNEKRKILERQLKTQKEIDKRDIEFAKSSRITGGGLLGTTNTTKDLTDAALLLSNQEKIQQQIKDAGNQIAIKRRESLGLEKEITAETVKQQSVVSLTGIDQDNKASKTTKDLKTFAEIMAELTIKIKQNNFEFKEGFDARYENINAYTEAIKDLIKNGYDEESKAVQGLIDKQKELTNSTLGVSGRNVLAPIGRDVKASTNEPNKIDIAVPAIEKTITALDRLRSNYGYTDEALMNFVNNFGLGFSEIEKLTIDFNEGFKELVNSGFMSTVTNLGSAIGEAFASGGNVIQAAGQELLKGFGNFLSGYGQLLIKYGAAAILKSKLDAAALIPGAGLIAGPLAIAAGAALVAAGAAINSFASTGKSSETKQSNTPVRQIPRFATGVQNFGGGLAMVGERGAELVNLPTGSSVVPNDRTNRILSNNRNSDIVLNGNFEIGLESLFFALKKTEKRLVKQGGFA